MDVHAPHQPLHSWRDFLIHIATITIGLLIALALEAAAEAVHHHNQRLELKRDLAAEIADNQKEFPQDLKALAGERQSLEQNLTLLRRLRSHQPIDPAGKLRFAWFWNSMPDAAWQTARESATLALLPPEDLKDLSGLYEQQTLINENGLTLSRQMTASEIPLKVEPDLHSLSPALIDELIRSCAADLNQIAYTEAVAQDLDPDYRAALKLLAQ